jgi:hypothetical protein
LKLILDSAKKNKTVKKVIVFASLENVVPLSVPAALSLASVVLEHPEIQEIEFNNVKFIEFGPLALAIQQNRKLTRLLLQECDLTPNLVECIRWLLTKNALESLTLYNNASDGEPSVDISGALRGSSSLKELDLDDYNGVIGSETFQAIPRMIRTNQDCETIDLLFSDTMTYHSEAYCTGSGRARIVEQACYFLLFWRFLRRILRRSLNQSWWNRRSNRHDAT